MLHIEGYREAIHIEGYREVIHIEGYRDAIHIEGCWEAPHIEGYWEALHIEDTGKPIRFIKFELLIVFENSAQRVCRYYIMHGAYTVFLHYNTQLL